MLGYPPTPPPLLPLPPSRPPKVFAPGWGREFEQAAPLVRQFRVSRWAFVSSSLPCRWPLHRITIRSLPLPKQWAHSPAASAHHLFGAETPFISTKFDSGGLKDTNVSDCSPKSCCGCQSDSGGQQPSSIYGQAARCLHEPAVWGQDLWQQSFSPSNESGRGTKFDAAAGGSKGLRRLMRRQSRGG